MHMGARKHTCTHTRYRFREDLGKDIKENNTMGLFVTREASHRKRLLTVTVHTYW